MTVHQLCSIEEACDILGYSEEEIQQHINSNKLPVHISNGEMQLSLLDVQEFLEELSHTNEGSMRLEDELQPDKESEELEDMAVNTTLTEDQDDFELIDETIQRDRIVILGRRRSGKTVFLTRLYEQLWNSHDCFNIKALSGIVHKDFLQKAKTLSNGEWVSATGDSDYADLELTDGERTRLVVSLDYSGELFTKAFTEGSNQPDANELKSHVDRACAVLLLLSPDIDHENDLDATTDDTFGMQLAVQYIRNSPDGDKVPIAVVITKADQYKDRLRECGGLRKYLVKHYLPLLRVIGRYRPFVVSAVQCSRSKKNPGQFFPNFKRPPVNLLQPIRWCWDKLNAIDEQAEWERRREIYLEKEQEVISEQISERRRLYLTLSFILGTALIVCAGAVAAVIALMKY